MGGCPNATLLVNRHRKWDSGDTKSSIHMPPLPSMGIVTVHIWGNALQVPTPGQANHQTKQSDSSSNSTLDSNRKKQFSNGPSMKNSFKQVSSDQYWLCQPLQHPCIHLQALIINHSVGCLICKLACLDLQDAAPTALGVCRLPLDWAGLHRSSTG